MAVACAGAIPQLGFVHEDSGQSFVLDIADLVRATVTIPVAFRAVKAHLAARDSSIERLARRGAADAFRRERTIPHLIERVQALFHLE